ncbi:endonuclease [Rhodococcus sp. SGAir0479]|uniref:endonuclease n=1 Tax=Rhodococcus sp. SGAir0479 TaxID=2567884 RepID=UPI0010CCE6E0|nr:endonuclease [Rhodococcus sp. SGAir0479]QCQ91289.1 endonuclease [Rhodococcus sp. SGAir0479]
MATLRSDTEVVRELLDRAGRTYARDAEITLKDTPEPLFQLLVLAMLLSARISAEIATQAARELFAAGWRTPESMVRAPRGQVIAALKRGRYSRYDESTATRLRKAAERVRDEYDGDLRGLAERSGHDEKAAARLLQEFDGIGPVGAEIFLREVQDTWTWLRPHLDERTLAGATELQLPRDPDALTELAGASEMAPLAAALVRVTLDSKLRDEVLAAPG